jgi:ATP-dependent Lon protease
MQRRQIFFNSDTDLGTQQQDDLFPSGDVADRFSGFLEPVINIFSDSDFREAIAWAESLERESGARALAALKRLDRGERRLALVSEEWREMLQDLEAKYPNFERVTGWIGTQLALCEIGNQAFKLPPILLEGPPGVGKTAYSHSLAALFEVEFHTFDFSTAHSTFGLTGSESNYGNSTEGAIWRWLAQSEYANVVAFLDEIDKVDSSGGSTPVTNALYGLLEERSARRFLDTSQPILPLDVSHIVWVAACNDPSRIEPALLSRFRRFYIAPPTRRQSAAIIHSIYAQLCAETTWGCHFAELPDAVVECLLELPPRKIKQRLLDGCGFAAKEARFVLKPDDVVGGRWSSTPMMKRRAGFV